MKLWIWGSGSGYNQSGSATLHFYMCKYGFVSRSSRLSHRTSGVTPKQTSWCGSVIARLDREPSLPAPMCKQVKFYDIAQVTRFPVFRIRFIFEKMAKFYFFLLHILALLIITQPPIQLWTSWIYQTDL